MSNSEKENISKWMMRFAWALEIILCLSGILIAFTLSYIGVTGESKILNFDTKLILLVGTLPLIGVALTELLKIPLVTGFMYVKSWKIKAIAGIALTAICILTFETMLTGQEQLFSLRADQIKIQKQNENRIIEQIKIIDNQIDSISNMTPSEIKKEANEGIQAQLKAINEQIDDLRKREDSLISSNNSAEVSELLRQVNQLEESKKTLIENHQINLTEINKENISLNKDEQTELENTFFKTRVTDKYKQRRLMLEDRREQTIQIFNKEIDSVDRAIGKLNRKIAKLSEPSESLKSNLEIIASQIVDLQNDKNEIIKSNNQQVELNVLEAKNSKAKINSLNIEKISLNEKLNVIRDELAISSGESFMHRLAALYYGVENLADLTEEQLGNFAMIFMFSVAGVISLAGPFVTFVAVSIRLQDDSKKISPLKRTIRYFFISLIKRLRQPKILKEVIEKEIEKEVVIEVPVEKIEYKIVEKPKVVEIPIFVQVPVPTDPKDLPKMEEITSKQMKPITSIGGIS